MTDEEALEVAKSLISTSTFAVLGTLTEDGFPYTSLTQIITQAGVPYLLLSDLSDHTKNIVRDNHISLFFDGTDETNKMNSPRITLMGVATKIDKSLVEDLFYSQHPKTKLYFSFADFNVWKLDAVRARLNAGFGKAFDFDKGDLVIA